MTKRCGYCAVGTALWVLRLAVVPFSAILSVLQATKVVATLIATVESFVLRLRRF